MTGGHYDVDVLLTDPKGQELYKQIKKQYDSHTFTAEDSGEYKACFSNEFSTFSHKLVYIDFQVGEETPLPGIGDHLTAMTQVIIIIMIINTHTSIHHREISLHWRKHLSKP